MELLVVPFVVESSLEVVAKMMPPITPAATKIRRQTADTQVMVHRARLLVSIGFPERNYIAFVLMQPNSDIIL